MNILIRIIISAFAVIISSYLLPGVKVDGFITALIIAAVLALLNNFVKPVIVLLTIPITLFSMGLFLLVINAFMIMITSHFVKGFHVEGFWWALIFSIILSMVTSLLDFINKRME